MNIITLGIGPGSAIKYVLTGGLDIGEAAPVVETSGGGPGFNIAFGRKTYDRLSERIDERRREREGLRRELDAFANPKPREAAPTPEAPQPRAEAKETASDDKTKELRSLIGRLNREIARLEAERRLYDEEEEAAMLLLMA